MTFPTFIYSAVVISRLFTTGPPVWSHQDTIIELNGNKLVGLPAQYNPAELDIKNNRLRIRNNQMLFTPYIQAFFSDTKSYDMDISASWYHDPKILPPYLLVHIKPTKRDFSYKLLFNLNSLDLIEATVVVKLSDSVNRNFAVSLSDEQKKKISASITQVQ